MADSLWTPDQLAAHLGVPVRTLYAWRHRGDGPRALRIGRHLRYRPEDVDSWLSGRADHPEPAA